MHSVPHCTFCDRGFSLFDLLKKCRRINRVRHRAERRCCLQRGNVWLRGALSHRSLHGSSCANRAGTGLWTPSAPQVLQKSKILGSQPLFPKPTASPGCPLSPCADGSLVPGHSRSGDPSPAHPQNRLSGFYSQLQQLHLQQRRCEPRPAAMAEALSLQVYTQGTQLKTWSDVCEYLCVSVCSHTHTHTHTCFFHCNSQNFSPNADSRLLPRFPIGILDYAEGVKVMLQQLQKLFLWWLKQIHYPVLPSWKWLDVKKPLA